MSQTTEALAITQCPQCRTFLRLPDAGPQWMECPHCHEEIWVTSNDMITRRTRLRRIWHNHPQFLLLLGLLAASVGVTALYELFPEMSPVIWLLFSLGGFVLINIVSRRSRRLRRSKSEVIAGLKVVFAVWVLSGLLFFVADKGLSLYPFHVDQLAIRVLLLIYPVAMAFHSLPAAWIPALVATLYFLAFALISIPPIDPTRRSSRLINTAHVCAELLKKPIDFLKSRVSDHWINSAVAIYGKWASILNASSLGILAFGLSVAVSGSSVVSRHADIVTAFLTQPFRAHAEWTRLEANIVIRSIAVALEANSEASRKCSVASSIEDCHKQTSPFVSFPPEWGRTVAAHQPPYPPPSKPDSTPRRPPPGPESTSAGSAKNVRTESEYEKNTNGATVRPRPNMPLADASTSRGRLYDQLTASIGNVWDAVAGSVAVQTSPSLKRMPQDLTPSQISAARAVFETDAQGGVVFDWSSELVASIYKSAEEGGKEATKKIIESVVNAHFPIGELISEFVDLFLSGPVIEEASAKTEDYVRSHSFKPIATLVERADQAARGSLRKLHQLWLFGVGEDTADDRIVTAKYLRQEMRDLLEKSFAFGDTISKPEVTRVFESLVDHVIPNDGSFDTNTVDRVMKMISDAGQIPLSSRFEQLLSLKQFGADTADVETLKKLHLSETAEVALNAETPSARFSSSELRPGWERAVYPYAMNAWFDGENARRENVIQALRPFLPTTIVCGNCVEIRTRCYISGPHCLRPGESPPCPRAADPLSRTPFDMHDLR